MKKVYGISFLLVVLVSIGAYQISYYYAEKNFEKQAKEKQEKEMENELIQADTNNPSVVTRNTKYIINIINNENEILEEKTTMIPENLIGCTRDEVNEALDGVELVSFSPERIVVKQKQLKEKYEYYLKEENGYITVLLSDKKTVYTYTDIAVSILPKEIQEEIKNLKPIENLSHLYSFLETYTS
ncbi:hypothetical protein [Anaerosacchariphilus polymeriproducens]|uniref:Bypass of forespore C C-terminal domain-containing protein n=1 Tax=Anaerosacchariphilus polymeriproducens TaxID=1812858 RepID=A0A371AU52_9FIRM|nr:hypothetical protein [Anaerosacchariphilus polymeriproducens]RDU23072.1 hypothetical protein DWV06_11975 [Anaerosacchariphilus polymeriproducens]